MNAHERCMEDFTPLTTKDSWNEHRQTKESHPKRVDVFERIGVGASLIRPVTVVFNNPLAVCLSGALQSSVHYTRVCLHFTALQYGSNLIILTNVINLLISCKLLALCII